MPTPKDYDDLLKSTDALVRIARRMYPKAGAETLKVVCGAAVEQVLSDAKVTA